MAEDKVERVKIGGYYYMKERLRSCDRTEWIIRISAIGNRVPVAIAGLLINRRTGEIKVVNKGGGELGFFSSDEYVFACEIDQEVSSEQLQGIKEALFTKIRKFFEMPLDEFTKFYKP